MTNKKDVILRWIRKKGDLWFIKENVNLVCLWNVRRLEAIEGSEEGGYRIFNNKNEQIGIVWDVEKVSEELEE